MGSPFFFSPYEPVTLSVFGKLHEKCPKLEQPSKTELSDFKFMLKKGLFWRYPTLLCSSKWIIYCKNCDQTFFSYFFIFIVTVSFLLFLPNPSIVNLFCCQAKMLLSSKVYQGIYYTRISKNCEKQIIVELQKSKNHWNKTLFMRRAIVEFNFKASHAIKFDDCVTYKMN